MRNRKGANELAIFFVLLACVAVGLILSLVVFFGFNNSDSSSQALSVPAEEQVYVIQQAQDPLYYESLYGSQNAPRQIIVSGSDNNDVNLDDGLVAYLPFNEKSGSSKFEDKESSHDASCSGNECPAVVDGRKGNAVKFDGVDDLLTIPYSGALSFDKEFTVSFWFNGTNDKAGQFFVGALDDKSVSWLSAVSTGGKCSGMGFYVSEDGAAGNDNTRAYIRDCDEFYMDGKWHLYTAVFKSGKLKMYIDGKSVGVVVGNPDRINSVYQSRLPIMIGSGIGAFGSSDHFEGSMDELRFWDRALSSDEVDELESL